MALEFRSRDDEVLASVLIDLELATPKQMAKLLGEAAAEGMPLAFAVFSHGIVPDDMRDVVDAAVAELAATSGPIPMREDVEESAAPPASQAVPPETDVVPEMPNVALRRTPLPNVPLHTKKPKEGPGIAPRHMDAPRSTPVPRAAGRRYVPKHLRGSGTGGEGELDLGSIKDELGIGGAEAEETGGAQSPLEAAVRRVLPTRLHFRCYVKAIELHHGSITPVRLARDVECSEEEALSVLDGWHRIGIMTKAEKGMPRFRFDEAANATAEMESLRTHAAEPGWHEKLLAWISDEGADG